MEHASYVAHNLPILRRRMGYTQETLAEAVDVSRQAVSKWESGATLPEAATLLALADVLDCSLDELMRIELPEDFGKRPPVTEPIVEAEPPGPEPEGGGLLADYHAHMTRFASMIAAGVLLVPVGFGQLFAMDAIFGFAAAIIAMMVSWGAAVTLFVYGGMTHHTFRRTFPNFFTFPRPLPDEGFLRIFPVGVALSVAVLVGDLGLLMVCIFYVTRWRVIQVLMGGFFVLIGLAVGTLVYLGICKSRFAKR